MSYSSQHSQSSTERHKETSCPVCAAQTKAVFDDLVEWQDRLAHSEPARALFLASRGFCSFHMWLLQQIGDPGRVAVPRRRPRRRRLPVARALGAVAGGGRKPARLRGQTRCGEPRADQRGRAGRMAAGARAARWRAGRARRRPGVEPAPGGEPRMASASAGFRSAAVEKCARPPRHDPARIAHQ